jgi:2'-5' RNA ligase
MQRRVFIAINLPDSVKNNLSAQQLKWEELPCRWTKKESLHITLAFLGYLNDEELVELCRITKEVVSRHEPFFVSLKKIIYGPPNHPLRMVWVQGEESKQLASLKKDLLNSLPIEKEKESRHFAPHITLGRLKQWEFKAIETQERPKIDEDISLNFEVKSIDIMESELKRGGSEYAIIESYPLE